MPERIARKVVLTEDMEQQKLVRKYLEKCGHNLRECEFLPRRKWPGGSGEQNVRHEFPVQVRACRSTTGKKASALLVVMIDADRKTTNERGQQLSKALEDADEDPLGHDELIVVLIPRRHVETWIRALLGTKVDEEADYKNPKPTGSEIQQAAVTLYEWTRPNAQPGETSPASLTASIPEWRKIPS